MSRFKHIHSSSRYDRETHTLKNAVRNYIAANATIITLTEVAEEPRERALDFPYWGKVTGDLSPRDDCAVLWKESVWTHVHSETTEVTSKTYFNSAGRPTSPTAVASVVLTHKETGKRVLFTVAHLPPSIEGKTGLTGLPRRVAAFRSALRGWKKHMNRLAKKHNVDAVVMVADWNLNLRLAWVRGFLKSQLPKFKNAWAQMLPKRGTHGTRIIDMSLYRGHIKVVRLPVVLKHNPSSDHTPYAETFEL